MREGEIIRRGAITLAALVAFGATMDAQILPSCSDSGSGHRTATHECTIIREIDDPTTGQHWLLIRDRAHPGGPLGLILQGSIQELNKNGARVTGATDEAIVALHPVIRAGDRVTVEQSNANADLRVEGIALSPATPGATLQVRLKYSGTVVQTVAIGQGRAMLSPEKGIWQ